MGPRRRLTMSSTSSRLMRTTWSRPRRWSASSSPSRRRRRRSRRPPHLWRRLPRRRMMPMPRRRKRRRRRLPSKCIVIIIRLITMHLLGSLLLLLLGIGIILLRGSFLHRCGGLLDLLLLLLDGDEEADNLLGLDHVVLINLELVEDIIDLSLGHLISPGLERVLEHLDVHLAALVVGHEGLEDEVVRVVAVSGHLLLEHVDHALEVAGAANLAHQVVQLGPH